MNYTLQTGGIAATGNLISIKIIKAMKKIIIVSLAAALIVGGAFAAKFAFGKKASELFRANVQALATEEKITVGELCAYNPGTTCESLGETFKDNIRAAK